MTSKVRWSLPDGVDELLPPKALEVEELRGSFWMNTFPRIMS